MPQICVSSISKLVARCLLKCSKCFFDILIITLHSPILKLKQTMVHLICILFPFFLFKTLCDAHQFHCLVLDKGHWLQNTGDRCFHWSQMAKLLFTLIRIALKLFEKEIAQNYQKIQINVKKCWGLLNVLSKTCNSACINHCLFLKFNDSCLVVLPPSFFPPPRTCTHIHSFWSNCFISTVPKHSHNDRKGLYASIIFSFIRIQTKLWKNLIHLWWSRLQYPITQSNAHCRGFARILCGAKNKSWRESSAMFAPWFKRIHISTHKYIKKKIPYDGE